MLVGEGVGQRDGGSCGIKPGSGPRADGESSDALSHPLPHFLHDRNPNSHHHPRQFLCCWNFHRVYHFYWSCFLQVSMSRNLWQIILCLSRALEHHNKDARELFPDAIVTKSNGNSVDISTILPSRVSSWINFHHFRFRQIKSSCQVEPQGRSDADVFLEMDGILGKTMQSGSMTWSEMQMMSPMKPACGRSGKERRPRYERRDLER